jgi:hypothetical protein
VVCDWDCVANKRLAATRANIRYDIASSCG